jgi:CHAT domain-containing protein/tetratricopeptide (TPR) repeat protein
MQLCRILRDALIPWCLVLSLALAGTGRTWTQEPKPKPLTPAQQAKLKERDRRAAEAHALWGKGEQAAAIAAWQKKLAIEREVFGSLHAEVAASLQQLGWWHVQRKEYDAARPACREVLAIRTKLYGAKDWRVTDARLDLEDLELDARLDAASRQRLREALNLDRQVYRLRQQGRSREALPLARQTVEMRREIQGENHPDYATTLNNLALLYRDMGDYPKALPVAEQARDICKKALGEDHPHYAQSLNTLALLHHDMGDCAQALPLFEQARDIRKKALGQDHPHYAQSLNNLAMLHQDMGDYAKALPLFEEARDIYKKAWSEAHPNYATSLNNLAMLHQDMGDYAKALPLLAQARDIRKKALGEDHPHYAQSVNNLAMLYQVMGDYAKALPLAEQACDIYKKALGEDHPDYATSLNNLAMLYQAMGDYAKALPLFEQARDIYKKALGEDHPHYATSLSHLAGLYKDMGDYAKALPLFEQARDIYKKALGEDHPRYGRNLNRLAMLHQDMGDYAQALPLAEQARDIHKKALGEDHPHYATSLDHLAMLYQDMGDYAKALPLLAQVRDIHKNALGEDHPHYAQSLLNLAWVYDQSGHPDEAAPLWQQGLAIDRRFLDHTLTAQSDRQRLDLLNRINRCQHFYLSCVAPKTAAPAPQLYEHVLAWKGALAARAAEEHVAHDRPRLRPLVEDLQMARAGLARLARLTPATPAQRDDWLKRFDELEQRKEKLERDLAEQSEEFRRFRELHKAGAAAVAGALAADTALVDFLAYVHITPTPGAKKPCHVESRLLAFVVVRGRDPVCVPLGPAAAIPDRVEAWRRAVLRGDSPDAAGVQLAHLVWRPLRKYLGDARTVLIAPDGPLSRLPFGALPGDRPGAFLLEEVAIAYLTSGRQLLEVAADRDRPAGSGLLAVGGLDYGPRPDHSPAVAVAGGPRGLERDPGANPHLFLQTAYWKPLPGTRLEAERIARTYRQALGPKAESRLLSGGDADAARLKRELTPEADRPRWRYLHLATHAFFQPAAAQASGAREPDEDLLFGRAWQKRTYGRNPFLASGLVLAGANRAPAGGTLTAEEVRVLDLRGCELAVLSACDTGLGKLELEGSEGVLGLQLAFQMAGARTLVASLWSVDDAATSVLMEEFYANLWQKGLPKLEALRQAQLTVLRHPGRVDQRRQELHKLLVERGVPEEELAARGIHKAAVPLPGGGAAAPRRSPPAWWAAFVLSGDPGDLAQRAAPQPVPGGQR